MSRLSDPKGDSVFLTRHGQNFELSGKFKYYLFERNLKEYFFHEKITDNPDHALDDRNEYITNSRGYRGPEFRHGIELVTAGCSQTYGVGVPEEGTWPALLAKQVGMSYVNISAPGASVEWIVHSLFSYFHEFGHPKVVAVLVPDLFRSEVVINKDINYSREISIKDWNAQGIDEDFTLGVITARSAEVDPQWRAKISKRPFHIEDTIPPEESVFRSFKHLFMLETYCRNAGIKLLWTGWSDDVSNFLAMHGDDYAPGVAFDCVGLKDWKSHSAKIEVTEEDPEGIHDHKKNHGVNPNCSALLEENKNLPDDENAAKCDCYDTDCHAELLEKFPDSFYVGTDRYLKGLENSHMGVHRLAHIADDFASRLFKKV